MSETLSTTPKTDKLRAKSIEWVPIGRLEDMEREASEWKASCAQYHEANKALDKDRLKLLSAIRTLRDAKGDYANQNAYEDLISLLPETK